MTSASEAASEILRRRRIASSLPDFALAAGFWPARHHLIILAQLERIARGEIQNAMFFAPPGSAKSTYVSMLFPAWILGQKTPHGMPWDILACSHNRDMAEYFSGRVRSLVRDHGRLLGLALSEERTALNHWQTTAGDTYRCAGAGAGIAGKRGDLGVIDDAIGSREDADSETDQRKKWDWYIDDFLQRLKPEAAKVIMATRWNEGDIPGRILPESWDGESGVFKDRNGREEWHVIALPSIADGRPDLLGRKVGEPLWPEWQSLDKLETLRATMSPRSWSAMHQQRPSPETGGYFQRAWFGRYTAIPQGCRYFLASDFAVSDDDAADFTVHVVVGVDPMNRLYVADLWRGRATTDVTIDAAIDLVAKWRPAAWLNEKGVILRSIGGQITARMRERNVMCPLEDYARGTDKTAVARGIQGRWSQGMVMLPEQAPWLAALEHELLRFPAGKHDDQVDALALIGLHLDKVVAPPVLRHDMTVIQEDRPW